MLEPAIGRLNFAAIYLASLLAGSFGALLFQPDCSTVGASTAIFGIFGALIVVARAGGSRCGRADSGRSWSSTSCSPSPTAGISIGGHLGGLAAGLITGCDGRRAGASAGTTSRWRSPAACLVGALSVVGAIAVAGMHGLTPNGI